VGEEITFWRGWPTGWPLQIDPINDGLESMRKPDGKLFKKS
jgi:hypothetical protein